MKKGIWVLTVYILVASNVFAQRFSTVRDTTNVGQMHFEHTNFTFGDIVQGTRVSHNYTFKNVSKTPLVISNVLVTCGCTVPEWPKTPTPPGKSATIRVFFNSAGKIGIQNKTITILSNTKTGRETLVFNANVVLPKQ